MRYNMKITRGGIANESQLVVNAASVSEMEAEANEYFELDLSILRVVCWPDDDAADVLTFSREGRVLTMKKPTMFVETVSLMCPGCRDSIPDPDQSSFYWTVEQLEEHDGETVTCECGTACQITKPSRVRVA